MSIISEEGRPLSRIEEAASIASVGVRLEWENAVENIGAQAAANNDNFAEVNQNQIGVQAVNGIVAMGEGHSVAAACAESNIDDLLRARAEAFRRS